MQKHISEYSYVAVHAYKVRDGGAHADQEVTLGKLIVPNVQYGWPPGPRVYTRSEPFDTALFHKEGKLSIDERAQRQWQRDNVEIVQFIDKATGACGLILCQLWLKLADRNRHGAGWQAYVNQENFEFFDHTVFEASHFTKEEKWLDPLPRTYWENLPVPEVPVSKAMRRVQDGQLSLIP